MTFTRLSYLLKNWIKKKNLKFGFEEEVMNKINNYLWNIKGYSPNEVKAINFKNQELKIKCLKSVLSFQLRTEEEEMKKYFLRNFQIKIKKIFYQL